MSCTRSCVVFPLGFGEQESAITLTAINRALAVLKVMTSSCVARDVAARTGRGGGNKTCYPALHEAASHCDPSISPAPAAKYNFLCGFRLPALCGVLLLVLAAAELALSQALSPTLTIWGTAT